MSVTLRSDPTSIVWSSSERASRPTLIAVTSRIAPKSRKVHEKDAIIWAPRAMKMPRRMSAPATPMSSTRCRSSRGTANAESRMMKTKRLSTDNDFSTR